jgi:hypothetical protein
MLARGQEPKTKAFRAKGNARGEKRVYEAAMRIKQLPFTGPPGFGTYMVLARDGITIQIISKGKIASMFRPIDQETGQFNGPHYFDIPRGGRDVAYIPRPLDPQSPAAALSDERTCPVCGYAGLKEPPYAATNAEITYAVPSFEICPSCAFEFGFDDEAVGLSFAEYRKQWVDAGCQWSSTQRRPPENWSGARQLQQFLDETI